MAKLSSTEGITLLIAFAITMFVIVWMIHRRKKETLTGFLVADREVGPIRGAMSAAVTFIWAPAVFICSFKSYKDGVPGIFWFMFPNILCFVIFAFVGKRLRKAHEEGFTFTQFIYKRLGSRIAHLALLSIFFLWMITAIVINGVAGGAMLSAVSGLNFEVAMLGLALTALIYSLISGMRASILTDVLQMTMVVGIAVILVPWVVFSAGGTDSIVAGVGGLDDLTNPFNLRIAYEFGILSTIGLIGGSLQDQMLYQRVYSVEKRHVSKMFLLGGAIFAFVPLSLSLLGFIGAGLNKAGTLTVSNPEMIGPAVIGHFLPKGALIAFVLLAFAGLASTLDSAFCAISSMSSVDVYRRYINPDASEEDTLRAARFGMVIVGLIGISIAFLKPNLLWVFKTYAAVAVGGLAPVLFVLYGKRLSSKGVLISVIVALGLAIPTSIYGNIIGNPHIAIWGPLAGLAVSTIICLIASRSEPDGTSI